MSVSLPAASSVSVQKLALPSPLGWLEVSANEHGVCGLDRLPCAPRSSRPRLDGGQRLLLEQAECELAEFFDARRSVFDVLLCTTGTQFQHRVWGCLYSVPYGSTLSYAALARRLGFPKSFRAVASALSANPVPIFTPCHRILRSDGSLGGFSWGVDAKRFLLELESIPSSPVS